MLPGDNGRAPAVTIVIPTYRHAEYLPQTLDSVFQQTFTDYEVVVVNDGSPDASAAVVHEIAKVHPIQYVAQDHAGVAAARNRGIALARGEFVALLDDDDWWPRDKLEWQVAAMRAHAEAVLVYGFMETFGVDPSYSWPLTYGPCGWVRDEFLLKNWIRSPGQTLIRTAALRAVNGLDQTLWGADDWDLYLRLSRVGQFHYEYRRALHYRTHASNASKNVVRMFRNACRVHSKHFGRLRRPSDWRRWAFTRLSILNFCKNELISVARTRW